MYLWPVTQLRSSIVLFPKYAAKHWGSYLALGIGLNHPESHLLTSLPSCLAGCLVSWLACLVAWPACLGAWPACLLLAWPLGWGFALPPLEITLKRVVTFCSKYAVKVDVDFAILQQNGKFL